MSGIMQNVYTIVLHPIRYLDAFCAYIYIYIGFIHVVLGSHVYECMDPCTGLEIPGAHLHQ